MSEREKFEAWAELTDYQRLGSQHDVTGWYYFDETTDDRWEAWQARAAITAASQQAAPQPPLTQAQIDYIGEQWDGCMYDAPGMMIDIGESIRHELAKLNQARAILAAAGPDAKLVEALRMALPLAERLVRNFGTDPSQESEFIAARAALASIPPTAEA